ncbi:MAG: DNA polymerase III subunit beta [bacterium]|nr:DNA polymerase III subunit beta [bacterium]
MNISCEKKDLLRALQKSQGIIPTKTHLPILYNIHLKTMNDHYLYLTTTNLEISLECIAKVNIIDKGDIVISNKKLFDIIKESPDNHILINSNQKELNISYGRSNYKLNCVPKENFPIFPKVNMENKFTISSSILKEMIKKVIFAISLDTFRYILNGVYLSINEKTIEMVATDGYRLAIIKKELDYSTNSCDIIIPSKTLQELLRVIDYDEKKIEFFIEEHQITFKGEDFILNSKLMEGKYPNFRELIPIDNQNKFYVKNREFLNICRRMSIISNEKLLFTISSDNLRINSQALEMGSSSEDIRVKYMGEELKASFNAIYLMDVLKNLEEEEICFSIKDDKNAGLLTCGDYRYMIMPMRIDKVS